MLKFVSKKFPKQRREIEDLEKTALVRITSDLDVKNTNIMSSQVIFILFRRITTFQLTSCL